MCIFLRLHVVLLPLSPKSVGFLSPGLRRVPQHFSVSLRDRSATRIAFTCGSGWKKTSSGSLFCSLRFSLSCCFSLFCLMVSFTFLSQFLLSFFRSAFLFLVNAHYSALCSWEGEGVADIIEKYG